MNYKRAKRKFVRKRVYEFRISDGDNCSITKSRTSTSFKYYAKTILFKQLYEKSSYGFVWLFWYYYKIAREQELWFTYEKKVLTT